MLSYGTSLFTPWCLSLSPCTPFISACADKKWPRTLPNLSLVLLQEECFLDQVLLQVRSAGPTPWLIAASAVPGEFLERSMGG